jgi:hypothetical protein
MIYFEKLSLLNVLSASFALITKKRLFRYKTTSIRFIDSTLVGDKLIKPILTVMGIDIRKLSFEMKNIKDENGELIRLRIHRKDLFDIQKKILDSEAYQTLSHHSWKQNAVQDYLNKGLIDGGIMEPLSVSRILYIIEVIRWHMKNNGSSQSLLIVNNRPWFNLYHEIALGSQIKLLNVPSIELKISSIHQFIRYHPWLYGILKNYKYKNNNAAFDTADLSLNRLYLEGRGDVSFSKNGDHSDFYWQINSTFPINNILYKHYNEDERKYLTDQGVLSIGEGVLIESDYQRSYPKLKINNSSYFRQESKVVRSILASYDLDRFYWSLFFKRYNVKLFLSWDRYSNDHMALSDAINDAGGISVLWQMAFDGSAFSECQSIVDIAFSYSKFSCSLEALQNSNIKYNIIAGYPKDYVPPLLVERARDLRKKLQANGAEKIVFVIDENSIDDDRWHTGHVLQQENYSHILEKVLETPWLGVVFKPKAAKTLRQRLGSVEKLLSKAEATGRCYIYETSGRHTTSAPPILAGLSADICIHGHLSAGTAALECALEGLPTLLIDREGTPASKLNELPKDKVVFKDWPSTIDAVMEHFSTPEGIPGFGDWSSIIDDLDPFRDGLAAKRIGDYLHWLLQGYEQGLDKESIMESAAIRYRKEWGDDKVLTA